MEILCETLCEKYENYYNRMNKAGKVGNVAKTYDAIREAINKHTRWLVTDRKEGERANFYKCCLSGMDLSGEDLRYAIFIDADLSHANLNDANLQMADLKGANLFGAKLVGAHLNDADLKDAVLANADLTGAYLFGANIIRTNFAGATLVWGYLPKCFYQVGGCGSKGRITTYDALNDQVICGCWDDGKGNHLEAFKTRIKAVYGIYGTKPHGLFYNEYMQAIKFFESMQAERNLRGYTDAMQ